MAGRSPPAIRCSRFGGRHAPAPSRVAHRPAGGEIARRDRLRAARVRRSSSRPDRRSASPSRTTRTGAAARIAGTARTRRHGRAPRPSRGRATEDRAGWRLPTPASSARRRCLRCGGRTPPFEPRASSQLKSAVRALPTCRWPVGLGAKRTRMQSELELRRNADADRSGDLRSAGSASSLAHDCLSSATAWTAIASPRPSSPTPSFVLPLMLTSAARIPRASRQVPRASHRHSRRASGARR